MWACTFVQGQAHFSGEVRRQRDLSVQKPSLKERSLILKRELRSRTQRSEPYPGTSIFLLETGNGISYKNALLLLIKTNCVVTFVAGF